MKNLTGRNLLEALLALDHLKTGISRIARLGLVSLALHGNGVMADEIPQLPTEVVINKVEFILIPEGWFFKTGGVPGKDDAGGGNARIWLDSYYIAKYEARARDLAPFLNTKSSSTFAPYGGDATSCSLQKADTGVYALMRPDEDLPATHLSWRLSKEWASWMGFRLPTEAEWEKAARGTDQRIDPWGDAMPDETVANFAVNSSCQVWSVNILQKGVSPYGVFNMAGNIREYVEDWLNKDYDKTYRDGLRNPPPAPLGSSPNKILKGGRWASTPQEITIHSRALETADDPFQCNGTRFAVDAAVVREHMAKGSAVVIKP